MIRVGCQRRPGIVCGAPAAAGRLHRDRRKARSSTRRSFELLAQGHASGSAQGRRVPERLTRRPGMDKNLVRIVRATTSGPRDELAEHRAPADEVVGQERRTATRRRWH